MLLFDLGPVYALRKTVSVRAYFKQKLSTPGILPYQLSGDARTLAILRAVCTRLQRFDACFQILHDHKFT